MKGTIGKLIAASVFFVAVVGTSGCATAAKSVDATDATAIAVNSGEAVVFGKFRLVRNGQEARLDDGLFSTSAKLNVMRAGESQASVHRVGEDGEFAMALEPGFYRIASISFNHRGERVEPVTNFTFHVEGGQEALYIGTMTLEATFDSGYYGVNGFVESYTVSDDCASDCAARIEKLGIADAIVGLMDQPNQVASRN
mgnify:CR=1 FL=1